jgi:photosynthetic reaction center H subunit
MRDAVGPAAYAEREEAPERLHTGEPMIVPLRVATDHYVEPRDPDPRGMEVLGADNRVAGFVSDLWVDRAEPQIRYLEVELPSVPAPAAEGEGESATPLPRARVLLPMGFARIDRWQRRVRVRSILAGQFAHVPTIKNPDQVTKREEDRITAYFASGNLYATPDRMEPLL